MIFILLEKEDNLVTSVIDKMYLKVPKSCRKNITRATTYDTIKSYKKSPLIAAGWLLIVSENVTDTQIKIISNISDNNIIMFKVNSRRSFNELQNRMSGLDVSYQIIDNYKISKEDLYNYVQKNLPSITEKDAKYLVKRQAFYVRNVVSAVFLLRSFEKVDRKTIQKYTSVNDSIPLYEIFNYVFHLPDSKLDYAGAVKLVYQYRFGLSHVTKYLKDTCDLYLHVFSLITDGSLSILNYKDFRLETSDKKIKSVTEYQLSKIVDNYTRISVEYLYFVRQSLDAIGTETDAIPDFITLLKAVS